MKSYITQMMVDGFQSVTEVVVVGLTHAAMWVWIGMANCCVVY